MTVPLRKWGNSLAIRIPKDIAETLSVGSDSLMELNVTDGVMTLKPKNASKLESLVSQINSKNLHSEIPSGESVGNEEW
jgi:antitoxin MazE